MKKTLLLPVLLLLLASCSKYQINMLSSTDMKKDAATGNFSSENDSMKITYNFAGRNAPMNIEVYNKLNEPLYIDWQRSAFITNDKAVSYTNNQIRLTGDISGTTISNNSLSVTSGNIDATATLPNTTMFIPPHTHINKTLLEVDDQFLETSADIIYEKKEIPSLDIAGTSTIKVAEFEAYKSPLNFKSYLTLYTINNSSNKYTSYQHSFYVSKIIKLSASPDDFEMAYANRGDYFYVKKSTTYGKAATGVTIAGLVAGAAILEAKQTNPVK